MGNSRLSKWTTKRSRSECDCRYHLFLLHQLSGDRYQLPSPEAHISNGAELSCGVLQHLKFFSIYLLCLLFRLQLDHFGHLNTTCSCICNSKDLINDDSNRGRIININNYFIGFGQHQRFKQSLVFVQSDADTLNLNYCVDFYYSSYILFIILERS